MYFATSSHPTAFVAGKSKVINPKKRPTTPRSKLQGLLISTRLAGTILQEVSEVMKIGNVVFWVDSMVVYHWVRNDRNRYVPFIANRLAKIHEHLDK